MIDEVAGQRTARRRGHGIGRAAVMIGVITVLARIVGFGRQVVFAHTVGTTCMGTAYTTANMVPNVIYDVVLGGALSAVVVPVLAGPAGLMRTGLVRTEMPAPAPRTVGPEDGEPAPAATMQAQRIASALLTWTVVILVPVSVALAVTAEPIVSVLLSPATGCQRAQLVGVAARMLIVFAPQVLFYGLAVVLYGILQSHRRFGAPALAPLLSSLVVIGAYTGFGMLGGAYVNRLRDLPPLAEYLLSGGTTLGVLALVVTALVPAWRLRIGMRPTLSFPAGVGARVRRLALAGVLIVAAQDASVAVVIVLANRYGAPGSLVIYGFAWAVFVVPYAVLAVPIATSAFPELSVADRSFDVTAAASTRAVMVACWLGVAVLAGARVPLARVFESHNAAAASVLAYALAAFALGLVGYGLSANLSRVLYACRRTRAPALAIGAGWLLVIVIDLLLVPFLPASRAVPALGLGTTIGLTVSGAALLILVWRERGPAALAGVLRASLAGLAGCLAGTAVGSVVATSLPVSGFLPNVAISVLVTGAVTGVFTAVVFGLDGGDVRTALARLRARTAAS